MITWYTKYPEAKGKYKQKKGGGVGVGWEGAQGYLDDYLVHTHTKKKKKGLFGGWLGGGPLVAWMITWYTRKQEEKGKDKKRKEKKGGGGLRIGWEGGQSCLDYHLANAK